MHYLQETREKIADTQHRFSALVLAIQAYFSTRAEANADVLEALARGCEDSLNEAEAANLNAIDTVVFAMVELTAIGDKKIEVIKLVREFTCLGLKEAKDLVERAPTLLKESVAASEAIKIKRALERVGATVTLC